MQPAAIHHVACSRYETYKNFTILIIIAQYIQGIPQT